MILRAVWLMAVMGLLALARPAWAQEGEERVRLRVGPLAVHPLLTVSEGYDDNVFRTRDRTEADAVTRYLPGLRLRLPVRDHTALLEYRADIVRHARFPSDDTTDDLLTGALQLVSPRGQTLAVTDMYRRGHDPRGTAQNVDLDFFTVTALSVATRPLIGRTIGLKADYAAAALMYDEARNAFRNRRDQSVGVEVFFDSWPRPRSWPGIEPQGWSTT